MIVRQGPHLIDTRLGVMHVDRPLDATQTELVVQAIERVGWGLRLVTQVELTEGGEHVRRIRYGG